MEYKCLLCSHLAHSSDSLSGHIVKRHKKHPFFRVSCIHCGTNFRNYDTFRKHVSRKHKPEWGENLEIQDDQDNENFGNLRPNIQDATSTLVILLLKLQAHHNLSQVGIKEITTSYSELVQETVEVVCNKLTVEGVNEEVINHVNRFRVELPLEIVGPISTEWKQGKYFTENLNLLEPVKILLGSRLKWNQKNRKLLELKSHGYIVPFLENLKLLLNINDVRKCIKPTHACRSADGKMRDFYDGSFLQQEIYENAPNHIRDREILIGAYYDDLEIANPVGVDTKKHKVAMFYWQVLNIPAAKRSKLHCIQLLGIAKTKDIKFFGFAAILNDFKEGLVELFNNGIEVNGLGRLFGRLLVFSGDNLALHTIAGFKQGVGFAHKICMSCYAQRNQIPDLLLHEQCSLRTLEKYNEECEILSGALSVEARRYWSKQYGINSRSVLADVPGFDVTQNLLHDPMHILFEGISMYIVKELLKHYTAKKLFTVEELNKYLAEMEQTHVGDLPVKVKPVDQASLKTSKLRQTASQLQYFVHLLPLAIASKIPDDCLRWKHFLILVKIQTLVTSPVADMDTINSLKQLVVCLISKFQNLYPDCAVTPKFHYLMHLAHQLEKFGPLRGHMCMRLEGKNQLFKRTKYRNFKNIPKSLAYKHQKWNCLHQYEKDSFFQLDPVTTTCQNVKLPEYVMVSPVERMEQWVKTECVTKSGVTYKTDNVLICNWADNEPCCFAQISEIFVSRLTQTVALYSKKQSSCVYIDKTNTYQVAFNDNHSMITIFPEHLDIPWPVLVFGKRTQYYTIVVISAPYVEP